jgi:arylformamidase
MKIFDVTVPVSEHVPIYEGDPAAVIEGVNRIAEGDPANVSRICCGLHTGTHVDAPNHFIDGTRRVDQLDLEKLMGPCLVAAIDPAVDAIESFHLPDLGYDSGVERILFKTKNSDFWNEPEKGFRTDFAYLTEAAARTLADRGVKLVGIDYLSIEMFGSADHAVHKVLLEKEVVILEGLDLRQVEPGAYEMICLPLKYVGGEGDGSPARTVLRSL